jgi:hypothetical protein
MANSITTTGIQSTRVSEDGASVTFTFNSSSGPAHVSVPAGQIPALLQGLLSAAAIVMRQASKNPQAKFAMPVNYWEVSTAQDGDLVMSFVHESGVEHSFRLQPKHGPDMVRALDNYVKGKF